MEDLAAGSNQLVEKIMWCAGRVRVVVVTRKSWSWFTALTLSAARYRQLWGLDAGCPPPPASEEQVN